MYSCVRSFIHVLICLLILWFIYLSIRLFIVSFVNEFLQSLAFICIFFRPLIYFDCTQCHACQEQWKIFPFHWNKISFRFHFYCSMIIFHQSNLLPGYSQDFVGRCGEDDVFPNAGCVARNGKKKTSWHLRMRWNVNEGILS